MFQGYSLRFLGDEDGSRGTSSTQAKNQEYTTTPERKSFGKLCWPPELAVLFVPSSTNLMQTDKNIRGSNFCINYPTGAGKEYFGRKLYSTSMHAKLIRNFKLQAPQKIASGAPSACKGRDTEESSGTEIYIPKSS